MFKQLFVKFQNGNRRTLRDARALWSSLPLALIFLLIEFFDELNYGVEGAVLPALRDDLGLSYAQVGALLGIPLLISTLVEPVVLLLGDTGLRKRLVAGGGLAVALSLLLIARADSFPAMLLAFAVGYPASGAFVTLSQATLMDANPGREPHWMARWTAAGSLGNLAGPLLVTGGFALALGWRWIYFILAALALAFTLLIWLRAFPPRARDDKPCRTFLRRKTSHRRSARQSEERAAQQAAAALDPAAGAFRPAAGYIYWLCAAIFHRCRRRLAGTGRPGADSADADRPGLRRGAHPPA